MDRNVLLVDDQRDILKLLRATLDSLKNPEIKIFESPSGEEALLESSRHKVDLLVTDYKLPGMTGVELMHKVRARNSEVKVILVTGMTDRKARDEMLNAGATAIFDKPIPLADFLDAVERGLGLVRTIFPPEKTDVKTEGRHSRLSDLLTNFRQDFSAQTVFLINDRGLVQARAGSLHDSSMEVSIVSTLTAIHNAGLKLARHNHQEALESYHFFRGGDNDMVFIPVNPLYALLVAGKGLAAEDRILETVNGALSLRKEVEKALTSIGATGELHSISPEKIPSAASIPETAPTQPAKPGKKLTDRLAASSVAAPAAADMEKLLKEAGGKKIKSADDTDKFWKQAAEEHGKKPTDPKVLTFEQAREMGLLPDEGKQ
jgi:CheY-like chemotaxis protein